ncbi:adenine-specific dna methyltransferase [Carnobacterium maltaromaticum]|uniref:DNA adenine methylase n=1 Tax=Carnobacterium maltaromaticum TaxID=2751 RepID=UPI0007053D54|nr:DNA adenine methylase [Carnobacterium maltaromaticum]EJO7700311.1 DNA adenine methylase [Listeria monocytogenes]KRN85908.1 adenine-specific dna methyltransferase [Carnobacterium maltaromaticum]
MKKNKNPLVKPFLKWAGGKRQLLPTIRDYYPEEFNKYLEPFVGAGAVFMDLQHKNVVINDFNEELINAYVSIRDDVEGLIEFLKKHEINNSKEYFYEVREYDRNGTVGKMGATERASRLIYLNKTCFNGLFRVNSSGEFNVPFGNYKNPNIADETTLRAVSKYLNKNNVSIINGDYKEAVKKARKGDFLYFDPPYAPITSDRQSFVGYTLNGFGEKEQEELRDVFVKLDKMGCYVMLSNSSVPLIHELYNDYKDTTVVLGATRMINSNASKRGKVDEVLVMNY